MRSDTLDRLGQMTLPAGFTLRSFQPGDESAWTAVMLAAFGQSYDFNLTMRSDRCFTRSAC